MYIRVSFNVISTIDCFITNLIFYCAFNLVFLFDNFILLWAFKNLWSYIF